MKRITLFMLLACVLCSAIAHAGQGTITGKVIDARSRQALPGATISIPELKLSAVSGNDGEFTLRNSPERGTYLVEVSYLGYKAFTTRVDLSNSGSLEFKLYPTAVEAQEVVITGTASNSLNKKNSTSVAVLNKQELLRYPSTNIVDAISRIPGVSQVTTGAAISKPVIRGLSYNRVITLSDGVKQEGQQWGDEHGIEVDQYKAGRVEVLRGAASLLYGSDAMGGVINIIDPLVPPVGQVKGEIVGNYATNNGLAGASAMLEGNANGFVWRSRGSYKNAYGYNTPDYRLPNSGFHETNLSGMVGVNKKWGYMHLDLSSFRQKLGLPEFEKDENGNFLKEAEEGEAAEVLDASLYKTRNLFTPLQDIRHYKAALNSFFLVGKGKLKATLAYQNNQRRELEDDEVNPNLFFNLKTYSYDAKYYFNSRNDWEPVIGVSGAFQNNRNRAAELLIPDYDSREFGAFAYLKKTWQKSTFNAGVRYDYKDIDARQMFEDGNAKFSNFNNNFGNISGAVGFTHEFSEELSVKANVGSAFRAPNIAELSADGVHEGTSRYEVGDPTLKPERSIYADASLEYNAEKISAFVNVYNNRINNYIYLRQFDPSELIDNNPVYHYTQDKANLYGMEAGFTLHPVTWIHFENSMSFTRARNTTTDEDLPFTPAPVLRNELRFSPNIHSLKSPWFSVGLDNFFRQNKVDRFETSSPGYSLLNMSVGSTFNLKNQSLTVSVSGNNMLNKAYIDHLSRFKTDGFLNPGRNISFNIYIPLTIKK